MKYLANQITWQLKYLTEQLTWQLKYLTNQLTWQLKYLTERMSWSGSTRKLKMRLSRMSSSRMWCNTNVNRFLLVSYVMPWSSANLWRCLRWYLPYSSFLRSFIQLSQFDSKQLHISRPLFFIYIMIKSNRSFIHFIN